MVLYTKFYFFSTPYEKIFTEGVYFLNITGIICEYNPFHKGHKKQFDIIRNRLGQDTVIICLMSGNYVQRGEPAVFDKMTRAKSAVLSGADLVLELPVTASLSSAEGFASVGVSILSPICDYLCFGTESNDLESYLEVARTLLSSEYVYLLKESLATGISFPAARQSALQQLGCNINILTAPNDILAIEYCKAILKQNSIMKPMPIQREGNYHDSEADKDNPSATSIRRLIESGTDYSEFTTTEAFDLFKNASIHTISAGERAILAKLRSMNEVEFQALPFGSEGLWRKLMHSVHQESTLENIITATKSKRYTRTRINRMIMCAYLGITDEIMNQCAPFVRILAFNDTGRAVLNKTREDVSFINIGERIDSPWQQLEEKSSDLYDLFSREDPGTPGNANRLRVFYHKEHLNG